MIGNNFFGSRAGGAALVPQEIFKATFNNGGITEPWANYTPEIGTISSIDTVYGTANNVQLYQNSLHFDWVTSLGQDDVVISLPGTTMFDVEYEFNYPYWSYGNHPRMQAYGTNMRIGTLPTYNNWAFLVDGVGNFYATSPQSMYTTSTSFFKNRMTYDGTDFKFYHQGDLIQTVNSPGRSWGNSVATFRGTGGSSANEDRFRNISIYVDGLRP